MLKFFRKLFGRHDYPEVFDIRAMSVDKSRIPAAARCRLTPYDPWLVGGGARYVVGLTNAKPKDYDFIIQGQENQESFKKALERGQQFGECVDGSYTWESWPTRTLMGGFRIEPRGEDVCWDIWCDDVAIFLSEIPTVWDGLAVRIGTGDILVTSQFAQEVRNRILEERIGRIRLHKDENRTLEHFMNQGIEKAQAKQFLQSRGVMPRN